MGKPLIFDTDPATMSRQLFFADNPVKDFTIVTQQDVEPVLAENAAQRRDAPKQRFNNKGDRITKIASIPNVVLVQLREDGILADPDRFKAWLNDPENEPFRTRGGKI